jgi:hypothetical protein
MKLFFVAIPYNNDGKFAKKYEAIKVLLLPSLSKTSCGTKKETFFPIIF